MNFIYDQNLEKNEEILPSNVKNTTTLFSRRTGVSVSDDDIIRYSASTKQIIITKDIGMVFKANKNQIDIIFVKGNKQEKWLYIPKDVKVTNRIELHCLWRNASQEQMGDSVKIARRLPY